MSSQSSPDPGRSLVVQKPKADIYTVLLGIALGAILLAIICLWIELARYKYDYRAAGASASVSYLPPAANGLVAERSTFLNRS
jgi:hypothetical protein